MLFAQVATVFGGSGFLGRYVVKRLRRAGHVVRVATRDPGGANHLRTMGPTGEVVPLYASFGQTASITRAIEGASMVVNLIGILAENRAGDFQRIHADGAGLIAAEASRAGVARLTHVSAIGADPGSDSLYARSKAAGERAVLDAFPSAAVLRPSVVFGAEDRFFNQFAGIARLSPVMPVFFGDTKFQPVWVGDVADAVGRTVMEGIGGTFELGGPSVMSFRDILRWILRETGRRRPLLEIPPAVARLQASVLERLPGKPLTTDQIRLLAHDNVVSPNVAGFASLGITPAPIELIVPEYLRRYRAGGRPGLRPGPAGAVGPRPHH